MNAASLLLILLSKQNVMKAAREAEDPSISPFLSMFYVVVIGAAEGAKYIQRMMKFKNISGISQFLRESYRKRSINVNEVCFYFLRMEKYFYFKSVIQTKLSVDLTLLNFAILFRLSNIFYQFSDARRLMGGFSTKKNAPSRINKAGMPKTQAQMMVQSLMKQKPIASTIIPIPYVEFSPLTNKTLSCSRTTSAEKQQMD